MPLTNAAIQQLAEFLFPETPPVPPVTTKHLPKAIKEKIDERYYISPENRECFQKLALMAFETGSSFSFDDLIALLKAINSINYGDSCAKLLAKVLTADQYNQIIFRLVDEHAKDFKKEKKSFMRSNIIVTKLQKIEINSVPDPFFERLAETFIAPVIRLLQEKLPKKEPPFENIAGTQYPFEWDESFCAILSVQFEGFYRYLCAEENFKQMPDVIRKNSQSVFKLISKYYTLSEYNEDSKDADDSGETYIESAERITKYNRELLVAVSGYVLLRYLNPKIIAYLDDKKYKDLRPEVREIIRKALGSIFTMPLQKLGNQLNAVVTQKANVWVVGDEYHILNTKINELLDDKKNSKPAAKPGAVSSPECCRQRFHYFVSTLAGEHRDIRLDNSVALNNKRERRNELKKKEFKPEILALLTQQQPATPVVTLPEHPVLSLIRSKDVFNLPNILTMDITGDDYLKALVLAYKYSQEKQAVPASEKPKPSAVAVVAEEHKDKEPAEEQKDLIITIDPESIAKLIQLYIKNDMAELAQIRAAAKKDEISALEEFVKQLTGASENLAQNNANTSDRILYILIYHFIQSKNFLNPITLEKIDAGNFGPEVNRFLRCCFYLRAALCAEKSDKKLENFKEAYLHDLNDGQFIRALLHHYEAQSGIQSQDIPLQVSSDNNLAKEDPKIIELFNRFMKNIRPKNIEQGQLQLISAAAVSPSLSIQPPRIPPRPATLKLSAPGAKKASERPVILRPVSKPTASTFFSRAGAPPTIVGKQPMGPLSKTLPSVNSGKVQDTSVSAVPSAQLKPPGLGQRSGN